MNTNTTYNGFPTKEEYDKAQQEAYEHFNRAPTDAELEDMYRQYLNDLIRPFGY